MAKYMAFDWGNDYGDLNKPVTRFLGTTSDVIADDGLSLKKQTVRTAENIMFGKEYEMLVMYSNMGDKPVVAFMEIVNING